MPKLTWKRYWLYAGRWQMSTPILWPVLLYANQWLPLGETANLLVGTIIANWIGASIFIFVDRWIFGQKLVYPLFEIKGGVCGKCNEINDRLFRLIKAQNYDRTEDKEPLYLCEPCSIEKIKELRKKGVIV